VQGDAKQAGLQEAFQSNPASYGEAINEPTVLGHQAAPSLVDGGHVLSVGLLPLPFLGVFPFGKGSVEEGSAGIGGES
jgi:hypothetical protein